MITKKEVKHIADLARLALSEKEMEKYRKEFSSILNYVEKLKEINLLEPEKEAHSLKEKNFVRKDAANERDGQEREKLLALSCRKKGDYLKIKSIL